MATVETIKLIFSIISLVLGVIFALLVNKFVEGRKLKYSLSGAIIGLFLHVALMFSFIDFMVRSWIPYVTALEVLLAVAPVSCKTFLLSAKKLPALVST